MLKDALLKKVMTLEKQSNKRGSLMPSRLKSSLFKQQLPSMIGAIGPYNVKYKDTKNPRYKIDPDTLQLLPPDAADGKEN